MKASKGMKIIAESMTIRHRLLVAGLGLLSLAFPGFVISIASKSVVKAFERLAADERAALMSFLLASDD
jgi:mannitol-specific phosphotransferase system IIBC component